MRISMTRREIDANNWFLSMTWGKGLTTFLLAAGGGERPADFDLAQSDVAPLG
jgi:hypothetical protein